LLTILIPRVESAQINIFSYTGTETTFTLGPGTYDITAYGAQGGDGLYGGGGYGAEMEARFSLTAATNLTISSAALAASVSTAAAAVAAASLSMAAHRWLSRAVVAAAT